MVQTLTDYKYSPIDGCQFGPEGDYSCSIWTKKLGNGYASLFGWNWAKL